MKVKTLPLLLILLLLGSLFVFEVASGLTTDSDHDDTDDTDDTEDTEDSEETEEEDDEDEIDDETKERYEREVDIENGDREWKIESEMKNGENKDKFEAEFKIGGGDEPEIELKYSTESDSSEIELKYRVNFDQIIEFSESGATAGYEEDVDQVVSEYELDKAVWEPLAYDEEIIDGVTLYTATATTSDGVVSLVLKLSTGIADVNSTTITPNAIKIDVIIDGYVYEGNGTYLALQADIKTESETEFDEESEDETNGFAENEEEIRVDTADASAFFSWVETANADGVDIAVIASSLQESDDDDDDIEEGEKHEIIYFTFDAVQPEKIVWDPKVGVSIAGLGSGGVFAPFPIVGLLSLLIAIPFRRRSTYKK
ncbi:MAG: hypothetical protein ACXAE3_01310 [Candidatus Kariarchaeaceae archaeon]